jgi:hypothetical protein
LKEKRILDKTVYLQYGCGFSSNPEEWINFDASPTLWLQRIPLFGHLFKRIVKPLFPDGVQFGDIVKGLPVKGNSCSLIYCSHVLEHLSYFDFKVALKNTFSLLVPGGVFRLVMPDLEYYIERYIKTDQDPHAAMDFMKDSLLGVENRDKSIPGLLRKQFGNSSHLWLWDYKSTKLELETIGFINIRKAFFGDSQEKPFVQIENAERWNNCLGIECKKPDAK